MKELDTQEATAPIVVSHYGRADLHCPGNIPVFDLLKVDVTEDTGFGRFQRDPERFQFAFDHRTVLTTTPRNCPYQPVEKGRPP